MLQSMDINNGDDTIHHKLIWKELTEKASVEPVPRELLKSFSVRPKIIFGGADFFIIIFLRIDFMICSKR